MNDSVFTQKDFFPALEEELKSAQRTPSLQPKQPWEEFWAGCRRRQSQKRFSVRLEQFHSAQFVYQSAYRLAEASSAIISAALGHDGSLKVTVHMPCPISIAPGSCQMESLLAAARHTDLFSITPLADLSFLLEFKVMLFKEEPSPDSKV